MQSKTEGTRLSRSEARSEETTRAAREMIDKEAAARTTKTERLRAMRMAREKSMHQG